jgi:hypothetical protein
MALLSRFSLVIGFCVAIALTGCPQPPPAQPVTDLEKTGGAATPVDVCALLTSQEIESIQREPVKDTKKGSAAEAGLKVSSCYFTLPTFVNSISLTVFQRGSGADARDPKKVWEETYPPQKLQDIERADGKKKIAPRRVNDVGEEAFWGGSDVMGALSVLQGNAYIVISVGGAGDQESKIAKCREIALKVLPRL